MQKFSDSLLYAFVLRAKGIPFTKHSKRIFSCEHYSITEKDYFKNRNTTLILYFEITYIVQETY